MNRRHLLLGLGATGLGLAGVASMRSGTSGMALAAGGIEKIEKTEAEWREILTPEEFAILREEKTERAFTSPLDKLYDDGTYHCAGCDLAVYPSETKYDSKTGWPSFYAPISEEVIGTKTDYYLVYPRTEVHCARCGGHFGHIFDDGPEPTGKRHCLNGIALDFKPADKQTG